MSLSPVENTDPAWHINDVLAPRSVTEIMRGPHLRELITEDPIAAVMVEPLRFIAPVRLAGQVIFPDAGA